MSADLQAWLPLLLGFGLIALLITAFRRWVHAPSGVAQSDAPGLRTAVSFVGKDPSFQADDDPQGPYVGLRLFGTLCQALAASQIGIENRGTIQNAQRAECVVGPRRYTLVLEWLGETWLLSVDWTPRTAAERRHMAWTHQVFAPHDSPELRQLLTALDEWLKTHPAISCVRWYRKEAWIAGDTTEPSPLPIRG